MVEAAILFKLLPISILDIYKVFEYIVLEGEHPSVSSPTVKILLECGSNRLLEGILDGLKVCSAIKLFFYYFS
jgi:hypothetical protein